jgi:S-methylmethionine-dependent homocysteine/selenocysteine methylase
MAQPDTRAELVRRIALGPPLLLDGPTGTELERRGVFAGLPLWSAHALIDAPEEVERIHRDYAEAGADILTANTFRTQERTLARGGAGGRAAELTARAVGLARRAAGGTRVIWIAGSSPPLEDCYRPDRVPAEDALAREHAEHARQLARAGADLLLAETMNTVREALAALGAGRDAGLPVWVSFVCDGRGRLLSGEPLADALAAVAPLGPLGVGVNCLPPEAVAPALPALLGSALPFGVYANLGAPIDPAGTRRSHECSPEVFARHALAWIRAGARLVGGCCGTTPAHIRAIARTVAALRSG